MCAGIESSTSLLLKIHSVGAQVRLTMGTNYYTTLCILVCIGSLQKLIMAHESSHPALHLSYYVQEVRGYPQPPNATLLPAAGTGQGNFSQTGWGSIFTFEHPLTTGTGADSPLWGKITGYGAVTTKGGLATGGLQLSSQHIFNENSPYNGSSVTMTGTFAFPATGWETIITGGTGGLRGYHGYALGYAVPEAFAPPRFVYKWDLYLTKCKC